ncbi:MAG: AP2 domain-containing protein [Acidobacteriota bacterium]|nr:AP2 domain-containing protein [Acidobacteriota bacterium]
MAKSGHKGISRIDSPQKKTHGWYVRVRFNKQARARFIPDRAHGGKEAALVKAIECRDEMERELGRPRTDHQVVGSSPRNARGVAGVRRAVRKYRGKGGTVYLNEVYEVTWNAGRERRGRTSVSIRKHGERRAFRMACAIRREKERQMYGEAVRGKWAGALAKVCAA